MDSKTSSHGAGRGFPRKLVMGSVVVAALMTCSGLAWSYWNIKNAPTATSPATTVAAPAPTAGKVAAIVNGARITDAELAPAMVQGVDRAVAIDRYVNKVVAADLARKSFAADADDAIRAAEREVLSQLYVAKRSEALGKAVTEADIKAFYDQNVSADSYSSFKVKFLLSQDPKDADAAVAAITAGKGAELAARFKPAQEAGDGYLMAQELPYGLGNVVSGLKKGEYSRPLVLRNGIFILHLEDIKANPKPELAKLSPEIKNLLVAKRLGDELVAARASAKVELK